MFFRKACTLLVKSMYPFRKNVGSNLSTDTYRLNFSFDQLLLFPAFQLREIILHSRQGFLFGVAFAVFMFEGV